MRFSNSLMPLIFVALFSKSTKANNETIWNALHDGFLPWAVEMINANPNAVNYKFHPKGETNTIWSLLDRFDLIRKQPNTVTWREQGHFAEIIGGNTKLQGVWQVYVKSFDAQQIMDIHEICGVRAVESVFDSGYLVCADQNRIKKLQAKGWVLSAFPVLID